MPALALLTKERTLYWPFDRRAFPSYILTSAMVLIGLPTLLLMGFTLSPALWSLIVAWPLLTIVGGWGLRRLGWPKAGNVMEAIGIFYAQGLMSFFLIVPLAALSGPFADHWLSVADRAFGFDWVAYANATAAWKEGFSRIYFSFTWQPVVVAFALFPFGQSDRGWRAALAGTTALVLAGLIFPFAPAVGPVVYYGYPLPTFTSQYADILIGLKGNLRALDLSTFRGLISFPSYHAAAAIIFTWSCWTTSLRWPVIVLNIGVCATAITIGDHYLADIIAGLAVGACSIWLAGRVLALNVFHNIGTHTGQGHLQD